MTKKKIPVKVYEEIKLPDIYSFWPYSLVEETRNEPNLEWIDNNGINTPYVVTVING